MSKFWKAPLLNSIIKLLARETNYFGDAENLGIQIISFFNDSYNNNSLETVTESSIGGVHRT